MTATPKPVRQPSGPAHPQSLTGLRLRKHADYQRAYASGRKRQSSSMSWFLAPQQTSGPYAPGGPRVGLTVGKVIGKAHERNRIKRRVRDVLRRHADLLPAGFDLILHPRRTVLTIEFAKLEAEVVRILQQANAGRQANPSQQTTAQPVRRSAPVAQPSPAKPTQ